MFGMPGLDSLHQSGCFGGDEIDPLAVKYGARARVRTADHHDRNAATIESGQIGYSRDAEGTFERHHARNGTVGRRTSSAVIMALQSTVYLIKLPHGQSEKVSLIISAGGFGKKGPGCESVS